MYRSTSTRALPPFAGRAVVMVVFLCQLAAMPLVVHARGAVAPAPKVMYWRVAGGDPRLWGGVPDRAAYQKYMTGRKAENDMAYYQIPPHVRDLFKQLAAAATWGQDVSLGPGESGRITEITIKNGTILSGGLTYSADGKKSTRLPVICDWRKLDQSGRITEERIPQLKVYEAAVVDRQRVQWTWWVFQVCANATKLTVQLPPLPPRPEASVPVPEEELYAYYFEVERVSPRRMNRASSGEVTAKGILSTLVEGVFRYLARTQVHTNIQGGTFNGGSNIVQGSTMNGGGTVNNLTNSQQQQQSNTNQNQVVDTNVNVINTGDGSTVSGSGSAAGGQGAETNQGQDQ